MSDKVYQGGEFGPFKTNIPIQCVGLEAGFNPFVQFITGQRAAMAASNVWQALVINEAEYPRISTGLEQQAAEYSFNTSTRKNDVMVYESIPKFLTTGLNGNRNPSTTLIVIDNGVADYVSIDDFTELSHGFGFINRFTKAAQFARARGMMLPKETVLTMPPNHIDCTVRDLNDEGLLYCQGLNANVLYATIPHVAQDAIVIREGWAKKCAHTVISKIRVAIRPDEIPLNLYGSGGDPKCFPDIGNYVNDEGTLMAIRRKNEDNFAALTSAPLNSVLVGDDRLIYAPSGSKVVDVQVYFEPKAYRHASDVVGGLYSQLVDYQNRHFHYYDKVCAIYDELLKDGYKISPKLNDLITNCMVFRRKSGITQVDDKEIITNCVVEITYSFQRNVDIGNKFTGRSGDKGVASIIWKDEHMPVDEFGIRADVIKCPTTVPNRLNVSQLYEQDLNRLACLMQHRLTHGQLGAGLDAYNKCIEFIRDIHPEYGDLIAAQLPTNTAKLEFVEEIAAKGFYFVIPPFATHITIDTMIMLRAKYNFQRSRVTYTYECEKGQFKTFTTIRPMSIGSKYMYLLGKIPKMMMSAHELTYINQFGIPIKCERSVTKAQHATAPTPIRFGEDEIRMLSMLPSPEETARFVMMRSGCKAAVDKVAETLLTCNKPSAIDRIPMTTNEMIRKSETISLVNHLMGVVGVDMGGIKKTRKKSKQ